MVEWTSIFAEFFLYFIHCSVVEFKFAWSDNVQVKFGRLYYFNEGGVCALV